MIDAPINDRPLRLLVNDRPLLGVRTGVGRYLEQLLAAWPSDAGDRIRMLCTRVPSVPRPTNVELDALTPLQIEPLSKLRPRPENEAIGSVRRAALRWGYDLWAGAGVRVRGRRAGVYFEPNHIPVAPTGRVVATIHDLSIIDVPQFHPPDRVRAWERRFRCRLAWVDRFICVSHATAGRLRDNCGVERSRIEVIHPGPTWTQSPKGWTPHACRQRLGLPERYIVCLGTLEPRKNHRVLLDAIRTGSGGEVPTLLLLGPIGWGDERFWSSLVHHPAAPRVLYAGRVSDGQALAALIGSCGLVYPSHYEGFGLPPLEAMSLGRRVVVSSAPSLLEVVGEAGQVVDPSDADGWARAMHSLGDRDAQAEAKASRRAQQFSWRTAARLHRQTFQRVGA
ncbi:MAG: hypothetical protein Kow0022_05180 [Phycisphaerales bacterium]